MSTNVHVTWTADHLPQEIQDAVNRALKDCGEDLLGESNKLVPHLTGDLENSGEVSQDESKCEVAVSYGGSLASSYARRQHEDTRLRHRNGRQAKYLEQPFNKNKGKYMQFVQNAIQKVLGK